MDCPNEKCERKWLYNPESAEFFLVDEEARHAKMQLSDRRVEVTTCQCGLTVAVVVESELGLYVYTLPNWAEFSIGHWNEVPEEHWTLETRLS